MEVQITNHAHQRFKERGYSKSQQKIQNAFDKAWSCGRTIEDFKDHNQKKYLKHVRDAHSSEGARVIRVMGNRIYLFGDNCIGITVIGIDSKYFGKRVKWREAEENEQEARVSAGYFWRRTPVYC